MPVPSSISPATNGRVMTDERWMIWMSGSRLSNSKVSINTERTLRNVLRSGQLGEDGQRRKLRNSRFELEQGEFVTDAGPRTGQEGHQSAPTGAALRLNLVLLIQPPLRSKVVGVLTKDGLVPVRSVDADVDHLALFDGDVRDRFGRVGRGRNRRRKRNEVGALCDARGRRECRFEPEDLALSTGGVANNVSVGLMTAP